MAELCLYATRYAHQPSPLRLTEREPDVEPLVQVSDDGKVTVGTLDEEDTEYRVVHELRSPARLIELIEGQHGPRRWQSTCLFLGTLSHMADLDREADRWTRVLLIVLRARSSLRIFATQEDADRVRWDQRALRDLLDAAAALEFFDPSRLAPFLQWLVAVLPRKAAREYIDGLLPVEHSGWVRRLGEKKHAELRRVVQAIARAQRRQYFFGRYDLGGAGRLRPLLGHLRSPGSAFRAGAWSGWLFLADRCMPRLLAGCVVGILPFLLTDEAWRLGSRLSLPMTGGIASAAALTVLGYLAYDRQQADPAGLSPFTGVVGVWLTGIVESLGLAALVQWLAAPSFLSVVENGDRFNEGVFLASAAFALGVGVFTQLIWQDKAVTAPP